MQQGDLSHNKMKRYRVDSNCPNAAFVYKADICLAGLAIVAKLRRKGEALQIIRIQISESELSF